MGGGGGGSRSSDPISVTIVNETEIIEKARREAILTTVGLAIAQILLAYNRNQRAEIIREAQRLLGCKDNIF